MEKIGFKVIQEKKELSSIQQGKYLVGSTVTQSNEDTECKVVSPVAKRPREGGSVDNAGAVKKAATVNGGMPEQLKRLAVSPTANSILI